jgi:hypothetical protein
VAELGREALQSGAGQRDRLEQLRMSVARHHLGRDRLAFEPETVEHAALEIRGARGICADRARNRPNERLGERSLEPSRVALGLERERRELYPERRRLGVNPMRAPDAQRVDVLTRSPRQRVDKPPRVRQHQLRHPPQLERKRRVEHVARCQAIVDPAPGRSSGRGQHVHERSGVVIGDALAFGNCLDGEGRSMDRVELLPGWAFHLLAGGNLDLAHRLEARVVRPHLRQLGAGVARNHLMSLKV